MREYIFLDAWVLQDYTKPGWAARLTSYLKGNQYTALISSLLLAELYNEGWEGGGPSERGARVAQFLAQHDCVVVDPFKVWQREFAEFPSQLRELPIELDLSRIPGVPRGQSLLMFLRRDNIYLKMGKDIREWSAKIRRIKQTWADDVNSTIKNAVNQGYLHCDSSGQFVDLDESKEMFLYSLDFRLSEVADFTPYMSRRKLSSVRFSSLLFWHMYVAQPNGIHMKPKNSDVADIYHLSILPYCTVVTADGKMCPTVQKAMTDAGLSILVLGKDELEKVI